MSLHPPRTWYGHYLEEKRNYDRATLGLRAAAVCGALEVVALVALPFTWYAVLFGVVVLASGYGLVYFNRLRTSALSRGAHAAHFVVGLADDDGEKASSVPVPHVLPVNGNTPLPMGESG